jgi:ribosomal protein S18 acetylase RimI-like enzyme
MMPSPRAYRDEQDVEKMKSLLIVGRQAANGTYYVHTGDLEWSLYYPSVRRAWNEIVFLWEGDRPDGQLSGWALLSPEWRTFDVFVHPDERGSPQAAEKYIWAEQQITQIVRQAGGKEIRTMWVLEDDAALIDHLTQRGFVRGEETLNLYVRSLVEPLPTHSLPPGFQVGHVAGEADGQKRASASQAAFGSQMPFEAYWLRYQGFMRSPAYVPNLDLVSVAPDGRFASFCICWLDANNQVGLFEPVGTHPDFQRQGLGKAVMLEGLHRMQVAGMSTAIVGAESDNPAAQSLYRSIGFQVVSKLCTYQKSLE